jgi:hypothetical protein
MRQTPTQQNRHIIALQENCICFFEALKFLSFQAHLEGCRSDTFKQGEAPQGPPSTQLWHTNASSYFCDPGGKEVIIQPLMFLTL